MIKQKRLSDIKTDFINNITHELKTPLATLSVATKAVEKPEVQHNQAALGNVIQTISRQNLRLQKLIDQVLDQSVGDHELRLNRVPVNASQFIHIIVQDFRLSNPDHNITTEIPSENVEVAVDKFHFTTALLNLLENAVKYGSQTIAINAHAEKEHLKIQIRDDGMGIDKKHLPFIFEKFYRAEHADIHNSKGLGLGLYYVDQIVKAHHGTISVQSNKGVGTTIEINLHCHEESVTGGR